MKKNGWQLLLIIKETDFSRKFQRLLTNSGFKMETAADYQVGLEKVQQQKFDLIICHLQTSDCQTSGVAFVKALRPDNEESVANLNDQTKVLALSSVEPPDDIGLEDLRTIGFNEALFNPSLGLMLQTIFKMLGLGKPRPYGTGQVQPSQQKVVKEIRPRRTET